MDPAERAFHQYLKSLSDGTVDYPFREHIEAAMENVKERSSTISPLHPFLAFGEYEQQVKRYLQHFPAHQLNISLYEDTQMNYPAWFANLLGFLEVDTRFTPPDVYVPSKPHLPHSLYTGDELPKLNPEDRAVLVAYYRDNILRLQDLIQRDLSSWVR
jgi:hypothetical protein